MLYKFVDTPIARSQVDRRSSRERRNYQERQERKRQQMEELFTVEQLVKMGFYDTKEKSKFHGVEVKGRYKEQLDADSWSVHKVFRLRISLLAPTSQAEKNINKLCPSWSEEFQCYTWRYSIYGKAGLWVALDLLNRIIQLPCWDNVKEIPLYWDAFNDKQLDFVTNQVAYINKGAFTLSIPFPPLFTDIKERALSNLELLIPADKRKAVIKDECRLIRSFIRHQYTPYDYLWQTNKMPHEDAKTLCNELIRFVYPNLFK